MDAEGHEQKKLQRDIDGQTFRQGTRETNNQRWPTGQRRQMEKETDETARDGKRQPMKDREPRTERGGKKGPEAQVGAQHPWALSGWPGRTTRRLPQHFHVPTRASYVPRCGDIQSGGQGPLRPQGQAPLGRGP